MNADGKETCRVKVTKVTAPALRVYGYKKCLPDGSKRNACLADFGEAPFEVVLPVTMLRELDESIAVRPFGIPHLKFDENESRQRRSRPGKTLPPLAVISPK